MIATNFLSRLSRGLALAALLLAVTVGTTYAQETYYVSNDDGSDAFNGQSPEPQGDGVTGPFSSIDVAIGAASDGDIILIAADNDAYTNGTTEDVGAKELTFGTYVESETELQAIVADSFQVGTGSATLTDGGSTSLVFGSVLEVDSGSLSAADGAASIGDGATIILGSGSITGDLTFLGSTNVTYDGEGLVEAGAELPGDLEDGDLTVGVADSVHLVFDSALNVDDVFLNDNSFADGIFSFTGSADGTHDILGTGSFGSAIVSAPVSVGDGVNASDVEFRSALTLSTSTLTVEANSDLSPSAEGDPILRINIAGGGDLATALGGTFNAEGNDYSIDFTTPVSSGFNGATYTVDTGLNIDFINDFIVSANDAVIDASLMDDGDVNEPASISGNLTIEDGSIDGGDETVELILPTDSISVGGTLTVQDNAILDVNGSDVVLVADATVAGDIEDSSVGGTGSLELNGADILGDEDTDNAIIGFTVEAGQSIVQHVDSINGSIVANAGSELFLTLSAAPDGTGDIEGNLTLNGDMFQLGADADISGSVDHNSGVFAFQEFDFTLELGAEDESNFVGQPAADISYSANGGALVFDDAGEVTTDSVAVPNVVLNDNITLGDGAGGEGDLVVSESFVQQHEAAGLTLVVGDQLGETLTVSGTLLLQDDPFVTQSGVLILDDVAVTLDEPLDDEVRNSRIRFEGDVSISTAQDDDGDQILDLVSLSTLQHRDGEVSIGTNSFLVANTGVDVTGGSVTGDGDFEIRGGDITLAADYPVAHLRIDPGAAATVTVVEDPAATDSPDRTLTVPTVLWLETGTLDVDLATLVVADGATIHREAGMLAVTTDGDPDTEDGSIVLGDMLIVLYGPDGGTITTGLELRPEGVAEILVQTDVVLDTSTTVNEELLVAASLSANGGDDDTETVSLADNATLTLSEDGDVVGEIVEIIASYDLTYLNYAADDTISVEEFPVGADVDTLTVNQAGAVADSDNLVLDQSRTINNVVLAAGTFDLNGGALSVSSDLVYGGGAFLASPGAEARVVFVGDSESEFALGGDVMLDENVNVELDKSGIVHVDVTGGDLSFVTDDSTAAVLFLNGGILHVEGDSHVELFQSTFGEDNLNPIDDERDQGFFSEHGIDLDSSYVLGNVRKNIRNIPSADAFAGLVIFPVGDSTGAYSPFQYTFDAEVNEGVNFGTDVEAEFALGHPDGSNGFPLTATTSSGVDYQINGYEDFYWSVVASTDVPDEVIYDAEGVRTGYENDSTSLNRLRLVRRAGDVENESNEWMIVGQSHSNFEIDNETHVLAEDANGGIRRAGSLYSFGIQEGEQVDVTPPVANLPTEFALNGNFPNPFTSATTISFDLPKAAAVNVQVIDILGRTVQTIDAGMVEPGAEKRIQIDASGLSSGVYFYRITAELGDQTKVETGKMTLVK